MWEDNHIITLLFARAEEALTALAEKYGSDCTRIARNILRNGADAEECVNDTYLAVWNKVPPARPDPLRAYVFRIVRNLATARYHANTAAKRNSFYDVALDELADCLVAPDGVEQAIESRELAAQFECFLDGLDRDSRVLFVRRYWYADSIPALAERLQISENLVSKRLSRLRSKLKKQLEQEGFFV